MSVVTSLRVNNFRNHRDFRIPACGAAMVILTGPNGAGKTNLLEALSLLSPGRGLRGARAADIQCRDDAAPWAVAADVLCGDLAVRLGTGRSAGRSAGPGTEGRPEKRAVRINGENASRQADLGAYFACVWLTPQMDRIFTESASGRRRFLDRLVFAGDPGHAGRTARYESALSQRARLLREGKADPLWLDALESQMAESGVAVAAARRAFIERLQQACARADLAASGFPAIRVAVSGFLEDRLDETPALATEEAFAAALKARRVQDAQTGGAFCGPHRSDFFVCHAGKDMQAAQCSTGEQKALLISVILAHAALMSSDSGRLPVLLLDEIAAHLDDSRRRALLEALARTGSQVWLTGTENTLFTGAPEEAMTFML